MQEREHQRLIEYLKAVLKYWWLIIVGLGLTVIDFAERSLGTWWTFPRSIRLGTAIGGVIVSQYLAYRDFRKESAKRISDREITLHVENEGLRTGVSQLEAKIAQLEEENSKLKIRPYDEAQRQHVQNKLKSYSDTERDLLRFLIQRGETEGSLIYRACQERRESCDWTLRRLEADGMILVEVDAARSHLVAIRCYHINPKFEDVLRDLLYPQTEAQVTPRFVI